MQNLSIIEMENINGGNIPAEIGKIIGNGIATIANLGEDVFRNKWGLTHKEFCSLYPGRCV